MRPSIVFTDLDGTLLDHATYRYDPALPALQLLRQRQIPLVFCSSKTRREIEHYRRILDNHHPFISENGGGIFLPEGYFKTSMLPPGLTIVREPGYLVIRLGTPYPLLRQALRELRTEGFKLTGFGDLAAAEVAALTGLSIEQAVMAKAREFDEPFVFYGDESAAEQLHARIRAKGLSFTRGALGHILGDSDKGKAVAILCQLFREKIGEPLVLALGDAPNDLPMLLCAHRPVVIRRGDGSHDPALALPQAIMTCAIGPAGWNEAIMLLFGDKG